MSNNANAAGFPIRERELTLLLIDLAGYTRGVAQMDAVPLARFLDGFYRVCAAAIVARAGRVVKFMGDACFAVFEADAAPAAVDAALAVRANAAALFQASGMRLVVGACVHVPPPPANQIVYVQAPKGIKVKGLFEPVYVTGKLSTAPSFTGLADAGYTLEADRVDPRKE